MDPIGHEQNRSCALPDRFKPSGLSARVKERDAVTVLGKTSDPVADFVSVEGGFQIDETLARPWAIQAVSRPIGARAGPGAWIRSGWIQIKRAERVEDPLRRDVILRQSDCALMRS
jgi:hypothetical protein